MTNQHRKEQSGKDERWSWTQSLQININIGIKAIDVGGRENRSFSQTP